MAMVSQYATASSGLFAPLAAKAATLVERVRKYREFRKTLNELRGLNSRDLADLGLSRTNLRSVAYGAVYLD